MIVFLMNCISKRKRFDGGKSCGRLTCYKVCLVRILFFDKYFLFMAVIFKSLIFDYNLGIRLKPAGLFIFFIAKKTKQKTLESINSLRSNSIASGIRHQRATLYNKQLNNLQNIVFNQSRFWQI